MSVESWKREFAPLDDRCYKQLDTVMNTYIAQRKWKGFRLDNVNKHVVNFDELKTINCSLCIAYRAPVFDGNCKNCPIALYKKSGSKMACSMEFTNFLETYQGQHAYHPEPMIETLSKVLDREMSEHNKKPLVPYQTVFYQKMDQSENMQATPYNIFDERLFYGEVAKDVYAVSCINNFEKAAQLMTKKSLKKLGYFSRLAGSENPIPFKDLWESKKNGLRLHQKQLIDNLKIKAENIGGVGGMVSLYSIPPKNKGNLHIANVSHLISRRIFKEKMALIIDNKDGTNITVKFKYRDISIPPAIIPAIKENGAYVINNGDFDCFYGDSKELLEAMPETGELTIKIT